MNNLGEYKRKARHLEGTLVEIVPTPHHSTLDVSTKAGQLQLHAQPKSPLEDVQYLAGHFQPRTTQIYDRRRRHITRNIVERGSPCERLLPGPQRKKKGRSENSSCF